MNRSYVTHINQALSQQLFVLPLLIVLSLVVARVDGAHYAPVSVILTPYWFFEACMLVGEWCSLHLPTAEEVPPAHSPPVSPAGLIVAAVKHCRDEDTESCLPACLAGE